MNGICIWFLNAGWFRMRNVHLKTKRLDLGFWPWSLTASHNLDLETLVLCNSEPLKILKNSHLQMFFKIGSLKKFATSTRKQLCWGLLLVKLQAWLFLKRSTSIVCCLLSITIKKIFLHDWEKDYSHLGWYFMPW